jgi:hypothetical protein
MSIPKDVAEHIDAAEANLQKVATTPSRAHMGLYVGAITEALCAIAAAISWQEPPMDDDEIAERIQGYGQG